MNPLQILLEEGDNITLCLQEVSGYRYAFRVRPAGWDILAYFQTGNKWYFIPAEIDKEEVRLALIDYKDKLKLRLNKHLDDLSDSEWIHLMMRMDDKIGFIVKYLEYWRKTDIQGAKEWVSKGN